MGEERVVSADHIHRVMRVGLIGERERGNGGVVFDSKDRDSVQYLLLAEIESEQMRERLEDELSEDANAHLFVVEEVEKVMHVWKIRRDALASVAVESFGEGSGSF